MGRHSASGGPKNPFSRKHTHLSKGKSNRLRTPRPLRDATTIGPGARGRGAVAGGKIKPVPARLGAERDRRRARYKRILLVSSITVVACVVLAAAGIYAYAKRIEKIMRNPTVTTEKLSVELAKGKPQEPYNILLLGGDARPGNTQHRTDSMIIARIDPKQRKVWMLSIPRDTRVNIPGYGYSKINAAYFHGGPSLAVKTVSQFTGMPINHYMEVDFRGFKKAVDAIGGVWIDVPVEIDDRKAASSSNPDAVKHIDPGYQLLDGDRALVFVRSRKFSDADFSRMKHQQLFFKALADQIASKENIADLPRVVTAVAPYVGTDMGLMDMIKTALALKAAGSKSVYTATVPGQWRSPYVWPDEARKQELVDRMVAGQSFDATKPAEPASPGSKALNPKDIQVVVRNGAGISGCAKQASTILKARAFDVTEVGNANQFVYEDTLVVYKSDQSAASKVAAALPPGARLVESRGMYSFTGDVLVVIGRDWDLDRVPVTPIVTN